MMACDESYYVLRLNRDVVAAAAAAGPEAGGEEGVEAAFDLCHEKPEKFRTGQWCVCLSSPVCHWRRVCVRARCS